MKVELIAITQNAEELIELAARTCYQSTDKASAGSAEKLLGRLLMSGHESPFEHAYATFRLTGCSRAMTHQMVRHRLLAVSQKSQRYVTEGDFDYVVPPSIQDESVDEYKADMETIRAMYKKWQARGLRNEDARYVLPNACTSEIVISGNFREFRHIFKVRCDRRAQWEIRQACELMLRALHTHAPAVFGDLMDMIIEPA